MNLFSIGVVILGVLVVAYFVTWIIDAKRDRWKAEKEKLEAKALENLSKNYKDSPKGEYMDTYHKIVQNRKDRIIAMDWHLKSFGPFGYFTYFFLYAPKQLREQAECSRIDFQDIDTYERMRKIDNDRIKDQLESFKKQKKEKIRDHYRTIKNNTSQEEVGRYRKNYVPCKNFRDAAYKLMAVIAEEPDAEIEDIEITKRTLVHIRSYRTIPEKL